MPALQAILLFAQTVEKQAIFVNFRFLSSWKLLMIWITFLTPEIRPSWSSVWFSCCERLKFGHEHLGEHGVVVRAFGLYWGGIRFESLSTHHCWSLSKSFIPSLVVWSMTKNNAFGGEKKTKKSNGEQSDLCDLEQVTLKPQLQVHHYLTTWLQIWYHSLLWEIVSPKCADLEKQNCLFGVHPAELGN